jgi:SAM-dependent methyltransferase
LTVNSTNHVPKTMLRTVENGRLVYYRERADNPEFWTSHWADIDVRKSLESARGGYLGDYSRVFLDNLPRDEPVLEAGCGYGRYVLALLEHGYNVQGVEFSAETVERARGIAPEMNIRVGDILQLDHPDNYFGAYISLGVVEHFREGPQRPILEAYRVIQPGGALICSVPYFNPYRRWKSRRHFLGDPACEEDFYQFAFSEAEFRAILEAHGFSIEATYFHGLAKGLKDEIACVATLQQLHPLLSKCLWHFGRIPWLLPRRMAHMITIVAKKPAL